MNKYVGFAVAAGLGFAWFKGRQKTSASTQVLDSIPLAGGDFVGDTWSRLNGADLVAQGYPNIGGNLNADPGGIGTKAINLGAGWNGNVGA